MLSKRQFSIEYKSKVFPDILGLGNGTSELAKI